MHGNWRDLRTVFNAVGLTPPKPQDESRPPPTEMEMTMYRPEKAKLDQDDRKRMHEETARR